MSSKGWIYIIQSIGTNLYKIGYTKDQPARRLKELNTGSPNGNKLILTFPGSMKQENDLHHALERFRRNGEWFFLPTENLFKAFVETVLGGNVVPPGGVMDINNENALERFLLDHWMISRNQPESLDHSSDLDYIYDKYKKYCRFHDVRAISQQKLNRLLLDTGVGVATFDGATYLCMMLREESDLHHGLFS